jgi:hypothetical protein
LTHARLKALTNKSTYSQKKILQTLGFTPSKSTAAHISDACESYIGKKVLS